MFIEVKRKVYIVTIVVTVYKVTGSRNQKARPTQFFLGWLAHFFMEGHFFMGHLTI